MDHDTTKGQIDALRKSVLFAKDFPRRRRRSHAELARLSAEERGKLREPGLSAIDRVKDCPKLVDIVRQLGKAKDPAAVPLLAELWADCALQPVRNAAGHALRSIGTAAARQSLAAQIDDADYLSVFLAVASVFEEDPAAAFDCFAHYFEDERVAQPGGATIPAAVLAAFSPSSFTFESGKETPHWTLPQAPSWLRADPRWVRLCVSLRRDKRLGPTARTVLKYADPDLVGPALAEALAREGPRLVKIAKKSPGHLLERYRRGEHVAVWAELRSHEAIRGDLLEEAREVAMETMRRVAHGADVLSERLAAMGWRPLYGELRTKPKPEDQQVMNRIEETTGAPLPLSLRAFWEVVGGINFVWDYGQGPAPNLGVDLPLDELDPLCIDPPEAVTYLFEEWEELRSGIDPEIADPFHVNLAPDYLHKANISGGGPYRIDLPFLGVDPIFTDEAHELPLVEYLRLCFRWAGFPRLERHAGRPDVREFLMRMSKDLELF